MFEGKSRSDFPHIPTTHGVDDQRMFEANQQLNAVGEFLTKYGNVNYVQSVDGTILEVPSINVGSDDVEVAAQSGKWNLVVADSDDSDDESLAVDNPGSVYSSLLYSSASIPIENPEFTFTP